MTTPADDPPPVLPRTSHAAAAANLGRLRGFLLGTKWGCAALLLVGAALVGWMLARAG